MWGFPWNAFDSGWSLNCQSAIFIYDSPTTLVFQVLSPQYVLFFWYMVFFCSQYNVFHNYICFLLNITKFEHNSCQAMKSKAFIFSVLSSGLLVARCQKKPPWSLIYKWQWRGILIELYVFLVLFKNPATDRFTHNNTSITAFVCSLFPFAHKLLFAHNV